MGAHLFPRLRPNTPWLVIHKRQAAKLVHTECLKGVLDEEVWAIQRKPLGTLLALA